MNRVLCRNFSTSQTIARWYKDQAANRNWYRFGYKDKVKRSGALPRLGKVSNKISIITTLVTIVKFYCII